MKLFKKDEKEKMLAKIQLKKCFFLKNFVIGLVVMVIVFFIGMLNYDGSMEMCYRMFGINRHFYAFIYVLMFGVWKILLIQFALVPFLSALFMEKHLQKTD